MIDYFRLLQRTDYYEITGDKMTSYSTTLGGGSINYWDGKRISFAPCKPICDLTCFVQVLDKKNQINLVQQMYHFWRPDKIINRFHTHSRVYIEEEKTIYNDTFVSNMVFHSESKEEVIVRIVGAVNEESRLEFKNNILIIEEKRTSQSWKGWGDKPREGSRIYKIIGFNTKVKCKIDKNKYILEIPVKLENSLEYIHAQKKIFTLVVAADETEKLAMAKFKTGINNPDKLFTARRKEWEDYFEHNVPKFWCDNQAITKMYYFIFYMIKSNIYDYRKGYFKNKFVSTSKYRLLPQWFWDSAFGAINEKWLNGLPLPKSSMRNILKAQRRNGMLPFTLCADQFTYGKKEVIQPFILPLAIWDYYLQSGDKEFLKEALPVLIKFDEWMMKNRDENKEGLVNLKIPGESGWDNSKRYVLNRHLIQQESPMVKEKRYVQSPDFNTYVYLGRKIISRIAKELEWKEIAEKFEEKAKKTESGILSMWDEKVGLFMDRFEKGHEKISVKTPGGIIPLLGGFCKSSQVKKIVKNLTDPKLFWTEYPVTTLSLDDPDYNDMDEYFSYWNGRIWPPINWLIIEGLCRVKEYEVARELIKRSIRMCNATGEPWCMENYHPLTGYPYFTHNIFNYIWGGMFNDMLLRRVVGIQGNAPKDEVYINPLLNEDINSLSIEGIKIGKHTIGISLNKKHGSKVQMVFNHKGEYPITLITSIGKREVKNTSVTLEINTFDTPHFLEL